MSSCVCAKQPNAMDLLQDLQAAILDSDSVMWTLSLLGQVDLDVPLQYRQVPVTNLPPVPPSSVRVSATCR
eukprot:COSAG02_NODE_422_length_22587_cov_10.209089_7_plen_71_part_00